MEQIQELVAKNWREMIRPRQIEAEEGTATESYGRFACEPLERGFGITLGNALRRTLLSALQGAAITSVRIEGVHHEFFSIPGVIEDVSDMILNLKEVRLRTHVDGVKTLRVHKKGSGVLTAGDLVAEDSSVEVINPDLKIATLVLALSSGASFTDAARLANAAAGLVVAKLGTATVTAAELTAALQAGD